MYFYRDSFGNLQPLLQQVQATYPFTIPPAPEIDWAEIIAKAVLIGGGLYRCLLGQEDTGLNPLRQSGAPL